MAGLQGRIEISCLDTLIQLLKQEGYGVIGPKKVDQAITYDSINSIQDLPSGWVDEQEKGHYRLLKRQDKAFFGYNIGARSFKNFLFPPKETLYKITHDGAIQNVGIERIPKYALLGVRACELHAILIQDKVFINSQTPDPRYQARREKAFIVSLNCHTATNTCFCVSMKTGPEVPLAYDLNLNEIINESEHYFILESGSDKGDAVFRQLSVTPIKAADLEKKQKMIQVTQTLMGRTLDTTNIKEVLYRAHNHPHWEDVAKRCVNCANCTLACPTCFCTKQEDQIDLTQKESTRTKTWDSCFSLDHSYIHDAPVRSSGSSRYRQWMTHKLASWHDQFDTSGCVGCGRCLTWCPVGIDLTEEYKLLAEEPK